MLTRQEIKAHAKQCAVGSRLPFFFLCFLLQAITFVVTGILAIIINFTGAVGAFISPLASFVLLAYSANLQVALVHAGLRMLEGEPISVSDVLSETVSQDVQSTLSNLFLMLLQGILTMVSFMCLWFPGIWMAFSLSMVWYIRAENPELGAWDTCKTSIKLMKGYKMKAFVMALSFYGWLMLGSITCGVMLFWTLPYLFGSFLKFYVCIAKEYISVHGDILN